MVSRIKMMTYAEREIRSHMGMPVGFCVLVVSLAFSSCGGNPAPVVEEPSGGTATTPPPLTPEDPDTGDAPAQGTGKNVLEAIPDAPHGQCCQSDDECGPISCEPWEYATDGCPTVCTYSCQPGDTCPALGGTLDPPPPCPDSGLCPVGAPWW